jgi:NADPH:quinone reductase-like Zn-dependent oxidoreductase
MRAYQLAKRGAGIDALVKIERPDPKQARHQILVKVAACSLNFRDLAIARGTYRLPVSEKIIPLSDGAGEVIEVGEAVQRFRPGDKVAGNFFQRWHGGEPGPQTHQYALGGGINGMLAEYVVLEEEGAVKIPDHLSLEEAATLPCAGVTAWHSMAEHARLIAGSTVLLQGTGGVSILGLQLAKAMGIEVIITSSSDEKLTRAKHLGADHAINYRTTTEWQNVVMDITNGRGVDCVVEVGGAGTIARSFASIRVGGKVSLIGNLSGPPTELNPGLILAKRANVQGISVGSTEMFDRMNRAITANKIMPVIDKVFDFDAVHEAYKYLASGTHFGKIVIRVAP